MPQKYAKTLEAVIKAETDTMVIGDALNKELEGDIDSAKSYLEVAKAIEDELGIEYSPDYLRNLTRTAKVFPAEARAKYRKKGIYPSVLHHVATADVKKRKEVLDDVLLAIEELRYHGYELVDELPEEVAAKMSYPEVFTKRTLELLWSKQLGDWIPTKSAILEAFGVRNDRSKKVVPKESVLEALDTDDDLRTQAFSKIVNGPKFTDLLATPDGEELVRTIFANNEAKASKEGEVTLEPAFEEPITPKKEAKQVDYRESFLSSLFKARKACLEALEVYPEAIETLDDEEREGVIDTVDDILGAISSLRDLIVDVSEPVLEPI
jgi:hypothetical protein